MCGNNNSPDATDAAIAGRSDAGSGSFNTNAFDGDSALRSVYRDNYERAQREERQRRGEE